MNFSEQRDEQLVEAAQNGSQQALETLIARHQAAIYRFIRKMLWSAEDAEDVTQEALIKIVTHLGGFEGRSAFRTWAIRIAANHALTMKKRAVEGRVLSFDHYAEKINACPDQAMPDTGDYDMDPWVLAEEAKQSCVRGMLMCFNREQRAVFALGAGLGLSSNQAAGILDMRADAFRKKLSRARAELKKFMDGQCGLVNPNAPCRCPKKTKAFIQFGVVDPNKLTFNPDRRAMADDEAGKWSGTKDEWLALFRDAADSAVPDFIIRLRPTITASLRKGPPH